MIDFNRLKEWAKTLAYDDEWKARVDACPSIVVLEIMVLHLANETGYLNLTGLLDVEL